MSTHFICPLQVFEDRKNICELWWYLWIVALPFKNEELNNEMLTELDGIQPHKRCSRSSQTKTKIRFIKNDLTAKVIWYHIEYLIWGEINSMGRFLIYFFLLFFFFLIFNYIISTDSKNHYRGLFLEKRKKVKFDIFKGKNISRNISNCKKKVHQT